MTAPANPTKEGYTFAGWDKEIPATMPAGDMTVKAQWTINQYTATFKVEGEVIATKTFDYGATVVAPEYTAPVGYTFSGWEVPVTMPAKDLTLDATLTANSYKVTFNANGEEFATATYAFGKEIQDPGEPAGYSDGCKIYTFDKWNETVPETMPAKDLNFYAVFTSETAHTSDEFEYQDNGNGTHSKKHACCGVSEDDEDHKFEEGICIYCEAEDPNYEEPSVPSVPSTPIKPAFPNWGNIFDKWFGNWWDKDEHKCCHCYDAVVTAPTCTEEGYTTYTCCKCGDSYKDDYTDTLDHTYVDGKCACGAEDPNYVAPSVPSTPIVPSTPVKPSNPIKPVIPGFGWIIKAVVAWLK